jgi:hypothetical protein
MGIAPSSSSITWKNILRHVREVTPTGRSTDLVLPSVKEHATNLHLSSFRLFAFIRGFNEPFGDDTPCFSRVRPLTHLAYALCCLTEFSDEERVAIAQAFVDGRVQLMVLDIYEEFIKAYGSIVFALLVAEKCCPTGTYILGSTVSLFQLLHKDRFSALHRTALAALVSAMVLTDWLSVVKEVGPVPILLTPHPQVFWLLLAGVAYQGISELPDIVSSTLMAAIDAPGTLAEMAATIAPDTLFTLAALDAPTVRLAMAADAPATTAAYAPFDLAADAHICSERSLTAITQAAACAPHVIRQCLLTPRHWMATHCCKGCFYCDRQHDVVARSALRPLSLCCAGRCLSRAQWVKALSLAYRLRLLRASSHPARVHGMIARLLMSALCHELT